MERRGTIRRALAASALVCGLSAAAGCGPDDGSGGSGGSAAPQPAGSPTLLMSTGGSSPSGSASASGKASSGASSGASSPSAAASGQADPNVATLPGGDGSAAKLVMDPSVLTGYTPMKPRTLAGYRMVVCGVDLEPTTPTDAAQRRFSKSGSGPFLEQHVRVYQGSTAKDVVAGLRSKIPGCRSYSATDAQGRSNNYAVTPLKVPTGNASTVSWRQKVTVPGGKGAAGALTSDVAVVEKGKAVVLVTAYAVGSAPDDDALAKAVAASTR